MDQTRPAGESPETRTAHGALHVLRHDLFTDAFAERPLPPLAGSRTAGWERRLPRWLGPYVRWAPHGALGTCATVAFLGGLAKTADFGSVSALFALLLCLLISVPVALVLYRPLGAFWISLAGVTVALIVNSSDGEPWAAVSLLCHLLVMTLVTLRTRPRLAPEMWGVSLAVSLVLSAVTYGPGSELPLLSALSAVVLVAAAALCAWRRERRHLVETETVTAQERAHRTLLEERAVIARELHDVVAHHMSVIAIQAEAAPYRVENIPPELATSFSTIRESAVSALTELRRILGLVRSGDPEAFGEPGPEAPQPTLARLDGLLDSVRSAGLEAEVVVTGAVRPLPQGVELSAYRLVQEALSNVLRHAPGARAYVELSYVLGGLGLRIVNGAPGRLGKPSPGAGHGLLGMRERVQVLGGEMTAESTDEGGFEVAAFVPVASPEPPAQPAQSAPPAQSASPAPAAQGTAGAGESGTA